MVFIKKYYNLTLKKIGFSRCMINVKKLRNIRGKVNMLNEIKRIINPGRSERGGINEKNLLTYFYH